MPEPGADSRAVARRALADAISRHGRAVLGNPVLLRKSFDDYMPDAPRELGALVAVAQAEGSRELSERVSEGLDPDTAVRLTCSTLAEQLALDPSVLVWAVTEYADSLGYQTTVPSPPVSAPTGTVLQDPTPGTVIASEASLATGAWPGAGDMAGFTGGRAEPADNAARTTPCPRLCRLPTPDLLPVTVPIAAYQSTPSSGGPAGSGHRFPPVMIAAVAGVVVLAVIVVAVLVTNHSGGNNKDTSGPTTVAASSGRAARNLGGNHAADPTTAPDRPTHDAASDHHGAGARWRPPRPRSMRRC